MARAFLTAEWRKLAMANYIVDPALLQRYLPYKTELDMWNNACYVSLVGFMFVNTRLLGFRIPFHSTFEEVNLRFYVRYKDVDGWKRGVVFIKEIVPKRALTFIANSIYKENYETMPMMHRWETTGSNLTVEYRWKLKEWNSLEVKCASEAIAIAAGSEEEFITEHYWGYTKIGEQRTSEYGVEHPRWEVYPVQDYAIHVGFGNVYGNQFEFLKNETPASVFLAEGSEIIVREGMKI
jgi:uncharacterized protein YqjF (DUF2071 family)